jgi:hypothetical protein
MESEGKRHDLEMANLNLREELEAVTHLWKLQWKREVQAADVTADLKSELASLKEENIGLKEENIGLKEENAGLKEEIALLEEEMTFLRVMRKNVVDNYVRSGML